MDLLLGRFADAYIGALDAEALADFERLLDVQEPDLIDWLTGRGPLPAGSSPALCAAIIAFHQRGPHEQA